MNPARRSWLFAVALSLLLPAASQAQDELGAMLEHKGDAVRGKSVFLACQDCHRKDGGGRTNGEFPRLAGQHAPVLLKQFADIRAGRRRNPSMQPIVAPMAREDLVDVAAYIETLPIPSSIGKGPGNALARGKELYVRD